MQAKSKSILFRVVIILTTVALVTIILCYAEKRYAQMGYEPGWFYANLRVVEKVDTTLQLNYVDSNGINILKPFTNYVNRCVNANGFIADFDYDSATVHRLKAKRKLVMVIGDSFLEGVSDGPLREQPFFELLKADNELGKYFFFCNFGKGEGDPLNYELIAKKYVPLLKPDIVIINYCFNDDMAWPTEKTGIPISFQTNFTASTGQSVASLKPDCSGYFKNAAEAYAYYYNHYYVGARGYWGKLMAHTRVTTLICKEIIGAPSYIFCAPWPPTHAYSYPHLKQIQNTCIANNAAFKIYYIPPQTAPYPAFTTDFSAQFKDLTNIVKYPIDLNPATDYISEQNIHFNKSGNRKFYLFLKTQLEQLR